MSMRMPLEIYRVQPWPKGVPPIGRDVKAEGPNELAAAEGVLQEPLQYEQRPAMFIRAVVRRSIGRHQTSTMLYAKEKK